MFEDIWRGVARFMSEFGRSLYRTLDAVAVTVGVDQALVFSAFAVLMGLALLQAIGLHNHRYRRYFYTIVLSQLAVIAYIVSVGINAPVQISVPADRVAVTAQGPAGPGDPTPNSGPRRPGTDTSEVVPLCPAPPCAEDGVVPGGANSPDMDGAVGGAPNTGPTGDEAAEFAARGGPAATRQVVSEAIERSIQISEDLRRAELLRIAQMHEIQQQIAEMNRKIDVLTSGQSSVIPRRWHPTFADIAVLVTLLTGVIAGLGFLLRQILWIAGALREPQG